MAKTYKDSVLEAFNKPAKGKDYSLSQSRPAFLSGMENALREPGDLEQWPIEKLIEHPDNKRLFNPLEGADFERLKADIEKNGMHDALIVTEGNADGARVVLAGHNRLRAARELGKGFVPVRVKVFKDKAEETRFIIRDNLHRRQLKPEQVKALIKELYGEELGKDRRGGDRKSEKAKGEKSKFQTETLIRKVSRDLGISEGTAGRHLAAIRNPGGKTARPLPVKPSQTAQEAPQRTRKAGIDKDITGQIIESFNDALEKYQIGCINDKARQAIEVKAFGLLVENYLSRLNKDNKRAAIKEAVRVINKFNITI